MISDKEILKAVLPDQEDERKENSLSSTITSGEVIEAYNKVILYLEQQEKSFDMKKKELRSIKKLRKEALKQQFVFSKQTNLDKFITIIE